MAKESLIQTYLPNISQCSNKNSEKLALFTLMILSSLIQIIFSLKLEGYFLSPPFIFVISMNARFLYLYNRDKDAAKCLEQFKVWGRIGIILILLFQEKVLFLALFAPFVFNQVFFVKKNQSITHILSSLLIYAIVITYKIPNRILKVQSFTEIQELKEYIELDYRIITFSSLILFCLSTALNQYQQSKSAKKEEEIRAIEVQKRLKSQETIVLRFSHELNNPLHVIISNLKQVISIYQNSQTTVSQELSLLISQALCSSNLLHCFLQNILDVNKFETNSIDIDKTPVNFNSFVNRVWETCKPMIEVKGLKAKLKIIGQKCEFDTSYLFDFQRVNQIILNLVNNSVKYTEQGKVKLIVSLHNRFDRVLLEPIVDYRSMQSQRSLDTDEDSQEGDQGEGKSISQKIMRFEVLDTGVGIEKQKIKEIFDNVPEKIIQDSRTKVNELKLGLSLWITIKIIRVLGGKVSIQSKPSLGTSVIFTIPMKIQYLMSCPIKFNRLTSLLARQAQGSMNVRLQRNRKKVLIVEDVPFNVKIITNYLQKLDCEIISACQNGQEAVEFCQNYLVEDKKTIDLICMDIEMPVMNGKEASKKIRELETSNNLEPTKLLFVSGNTIKREIDKCLDKEGEIRGDGFLRKPMSQEEFNEKFYQLVQN